MKTSLARHTFVSPRSAAILLGVTDGEIYSLYNNVPPMYISLQEIWDIEGQKLKDGERDAIWFNSPAAQRDPILNLKIDYLLELLSIAFPLSTSIIDKQELEDLRQDFTQLLPPKGLTIGIALEVIRIVVAKYEHLTGPIYEYVERLSKLGFFEL